MGAFTMQRYPVAPQGEHTSVWRVERSGRIFGQVNTLAAIEEGFAVHVRFSRTLLPAVLAIPALLAIAPEAGAQLARPEEVVQITAALPKTGFNPGETFQAALILDIMEGYHLNAHRVKDASLIPTDLEIPADSPVTFPFVRYPEDQARGDKPAPGLYDDQYRKRVFIRLVGRIPTEAEPGTLKVPMKVRYQACTETVCLYPYNKPVELEIPVVAPGTKVEMINREIFGEPGSGKAGRRTRTLPIP